MSDYIDKDITCKDCNSTFVFTAGEQQFYAEREFSNPVRCKNCRAARKAQREGDTADYSQRQKEAASEPVRHGKGRRRSDDTYQAVEYRRR